MLTKKALRLGKAPLPETPPHPRFHVSVATATLASPASVRHVPCVPSGASAKDHARRWNRLHPAALRPFLAASSIRSRNAGGRCSACAARAPSSKATFPASARLLLSRRGEASGVALAQSLLGGLRLRLAGRAARFLTALAERFGPDPVVSKRRSPPTRERRRRGDARTPLAAEPRRQELFRRLNLAPGGTAALVHMREDLIARLTRTAGAEARRCGFRPPLLVLVQPGLSGAETHRLDDAGQHPGKDHPLRGRARDRELGRSAQPARAGGPPLLRLLSSAAHRRAADLRRGRADQGDPRRRSRRSSTSRAGRSPRATRRPRCSIRSRTPRRALPASLRQLPDQAGGRGTEARTAEPQDLRHPLAGAGLFGLARPRAQGRAPAT